MESRLARGYASGMVRRLVARSPTTSRKSCACVVVSMRKKLRICASRAVLLITEWSANVTDEQDFQEIDHGLTHRT